jgi:hypothetical protein
MLQLFCALTKISSNQTGKRAMITIIGLAAAWIAGGGLFLSGMVREAPNADLMDCLAGARRFEPAALVALAGFFILWPAIWVGAHVAKKMRRDSKRA